MNDFSNLSSSVVSAAIIDCFYVSQNGIHSSQNSTLVVFSAHSSSSSVLEHSLQATISLTLSCSFCYRLLRFSFGHDAGL
jgi:hypothetical protein